MSILSLGLLLPLGAGAFPDRAIAIVTYAAGQTPAKHITLVRGADRRTIESRASTVDELLAENGIVRQPEDRVSSDPQSAVSDGMTLEYRPAIDVTLAVDGTTRRIHTPASTVGDVVTGEQVKLRPHDSIEPSLGTALVPDTVINVSRTSSWLERIRTRIARSTARRYDVGMVPGTQRIVDPGTDGTKETTVAVLAPNPQVTPQRMFLADRILHRPRARVIAIGVGDASPLAGFARRGFSGTMRLADAALKMIATAYTAACSGCSGTTASGRPAGHGVVAVDPRVIPLGTHLFIPGYGHALAGDTGGAIRGNRIDLGFDTHRDALTFGRRPIVVYVLK